MLDMNDDATMLVSDICCEKMLLLGTRFCLSDAMYVPLICIKGQSFAQFIQLVSVATRK